MARPRICALKVMKDSSTSLSLVLIEVDDGVMIHPK